jgi:hypothetical protein
VRQSVQRGDVKGVYCRVPGLKETWRD